MFTTMAPLRDGAAVIGWVSPFRYGSILYLSRLPAIRISAYDPNTCAEQSLEVQATTNDRPPINDINPNTCKSGVEWQLGCFVVFPCPATSRCSLLVGKIDEGVRVEEGDGFKVLWYTY